MRGDAVKRVTDALEARDARRQGVNWTCPGHADRTPSLSVLQGNSGAIVKCRADCETPVVVAELGLTMADLFDEPKVNGNGHREIDEVYSYTDEHGRPLYEVVRFAPKDFRQRRPDGTWSLNGVRRVIYRLPRVLEAAQAGGTVFVAEGERDVHALERAGAVATTNAGGAGKWRDEYAEALTGATVVVIADRDEPGRAHAQTVARSVERVAKSVKVVEALEGKDAADHFRAGHGLDALQPTDPIVAPAAVTAAPAWPDPPTPEAFHGLAGELVAAIDPHTEADPAAVLITFLVAYGNLVGRGPHVLRGDSEHGPNEFVCVVGETGVGRKGTSWAAVRRVMKAVDPKWRVVDGLVSGEGVIFHVRDRREVRRKPRTKEERARADDGGYFVEVADEGVSDKRLCCVETEFARPLGAIDRKDNTLSPVLRQLWDSGDARTLAKNSHDQTTGALVSAVAHITPSEVKAKMAATEQFNGFSNRFLWVCSRRSKILPDEGSIPKATVMRLAERVRETLPIARCTLEMSLSPDAQALWAGRYEALSTPSSDLIGAITARATAHVLRLAVIYALLDERPVVEAEHLQAAFAVWDFCARSASWVFGGSTGDPVADQILAALRQAAGGTTRTEIRDVLGRNQSTDRIARALTVLTIAGKARVVHEMAPGRPATERWFATEGPS